MRWLPISLIVSSIEHPDDSIDENAQQNQGPSFRESCRPTAVGLWGIEFRGIEVGCSVGNDRVRRTIGSFVCSSVPTISAAQSSTALTLRPKLVACGSLARALRPRPRFRLATP